MRSPPASKPRRGPRLLYWLNPSRFLRPPATRCLRTGRSRPWSRPSSRWRMCSTPWGLATIFSGTYDVIVLSRCAGVLASHTLLTCACATSSRTRVFLKYFHMEELEIKLSTYQTSATVMQKGWSMGRRNLHHRAMSVAPVGAASAACRGSTFLAVLPRRQWRVAIWPGTAWHSGGSAKWQRKRRRPPCWRPPRTALPALSRCVQCGTRAHHKQRACASQAACWPLRDTTLRRTATCPFTAARKARGRGRETGKDAKAGQGAPGAGPNAGAGAKSHAASLCSGRGRGTLARPPAV